MSRTASFSVSRNPAGTQVYAAAPRGMKPEEAAVFVAELLKFARGRTGCPGCISGTPIFIHEEEVEHAVVVELAR